MASPPKPWKAEYAKSGRSACKTCKTPIDKEILRLGKMVQSTKFDGFMPMWNHARCIMKKAKQIKSCDDVEGIETLRWEDQQKIRQYVEGGGSGSPSSSASTATKGTIEASKTARATCKICKEKITTGEVRISSKPEGQGARGLVWHHAKCFMDSCPAIQPKSLDGWESLSDSDKKTVDSMFKKVPTTKEGKEVIEEKETVKGISKRKATVDRDGKSKIAKTEDCEPEPSKLNSLLEAQTKELWALKDDLKKNVSTAELREMLEANNQSSSGSEIDLRDRCADGMLFGPLEICSLCSGHLHYSGGTYKCRGFLSEWSKCAYLTSKPARSKGKWKIPEEMTNQYLKKWFKTQPLKKPTRIMPPPSPCAPGKLAGNGTPQSSYSENLGDLKVSIISFSSKTLDEWKTKVESVGGQFHAKLKKDTNCLVVIGVPDNLNAETRKARRMKIPIVREDYLVDCFKRNKKLRFDMYKIESTEESKSMVTVKVKGRSAVHESSGLQDTGHILEHGKSIYNTTLSLADLSTGINSYYILQIIEDDKGSDCHVFRKWGRVGNEKIGGVKLEEMSKADAIIEFKRLFLEKTGNTWESWEQKTLQKQPGKFYPLDIVLTIFLNYFMKEVADGWVGYQVKKGLGKDYGVNKDSPQKNKFKDAKSELAPPLAELMKMLFNVETYRAAMMEFEINMAEMPLGKLSKSNIQKGFEVLTELQNLLNQVTDNPAVKESMIVDASNRFFTVIPSVHPHVIKDEDDFKLKVKMLEALQDIEIASKIVGFDVDNDDSLDDKYRKLQCEMVPLPHDSEDYRLVEKYLQTTHAPTHTDWALELEEVFTVERRGEFEKFSPYKNKLKNKMLLWHGSRLTNFVGILSQGLRIAPPEAPATGYMFGKGVYFADLVSKSAQYCFTDKKNPVGLMLLSEVALGEMYELKKAKYIDKPPKGKDSTKGLGKKIPNESEHITWRDDVVVPCGKPVSSNVKASELLYNEYIVYKTDQVKLQFLLKVRFHHKR